MLELAMLADALPTGYYGATCANVTPGSTVYVAGAGPVRQLAKPPHVRV
jgi:glutathione-independent formaldehyde dehydrogenase